MFLADPTGLLWCFSLCRQCLYNSPPFSLSLRNHLQMVSCETAIFSCFFKYPLICLGDQSSRINPNYFFVPLSHRQRLVLPCADNTYVTKAAAKVKSHLPALRCVGSESRKHELTAVLDELSEKRRRTLISLDNGSAPVAIPDFTRGHWNDVQGYRHAFVE